MEQRRRTIASRFSVFIGMKISQPLAQLGLVRLLIQERAAGAAVCQMRAQRLGRRIAQTAGQQLAELGPLGIAYGRHADPPIKRQGSAANPVVTTACPRPNLELPATAA